MYLLGRCSCDGSLGMVLGAVPSGRCLPKGARKARSRARHTQPRIHVHKDKGDPDIRVWCCQRNSFVQLSIALVRMIVQHTTTPLRGSAIRTRSKDRGRSRFRSAFGPPSMKVAGCPRDGTPASERQQLVLPGVVLITRAGGIGVSIFFRSARHDVQLSF